MQTKSGSHKVYIRNSVQFRLRIRWEFNQWRSKYQLSKIYDDAVRPLVDSAFQGAKVTCFAYGQTGSGKTFTMNGSQKLGVVGLYELGAHDIFAYLADVMILKFSHDSIIWRLNFPFSKFTAESSSIFWIKDRSSRSEKTISKTLTSLGLKKDKLMTISSFMSA